MIEVQKIDWKNGVFLITPAAELHSHHNRGSKRMISFVVFYEGLHWYLLQKVLAGTKIIIYNLFFLLLNYIKSC